LIQAVVIVAATCFTAAGDGEGSTPAAAAFEPVKLVLPTRPAFGRDAGKPAALEPESAFTPTPAWAFQLSAALCGLALVGTCGAAWTLSRRRDAEGTRHRLTIGAKLALSMGGITTALMAVATITAAKQRTVGDALVTYQEISGDARLISALSTDFMSARREARNFLLTTSDQSLHNFSDAMASASVRLQRAKSTIHQPDEVELLNDIEGQLARYDEAFIKVARAVDTRDGIVASQLNVAAAKAAELLTSIAAATESSEDPRSAAAVNKARADLNQARVNFFKFLSFNRDADAQAASAAGDTALAEVKELAENAGKSRKPELENAAAAVAFWKEHMDEAIRETHHSNELTASTVDKIAPAIMETIDKLEHRISADEARICAQATAEIVSSRNATMGIAGTAILLSVCLSVWLVRSVTSSLSRVLPALQAIASGNLQLRPLEIKASDELGELARATDSMASSLRTLIADICGTTREVAAAATEIAASSEQMAAGMNKQEEQATQVSAAIEEMSASVTEVAQKSAQASEAARASQSDADEGGSVVSKTVEEMGAIAQDVSQSAGAISELGKKGEQIGQIIEVINDIADQTNLLALNAAIEAARAGEHGRGFAVVADEVRKLAERTQQATEEVSRSIREIQEDTKGAVRRIESGSQRVSRGVELSNTAGDALKRIVASSQSLTGMVQSIAAASEEQSSASEQISRSVQQISAVTRESAQGAAQAANAAGELSRQAERLQQLVGRFKV
jgi:methyl-accepting chemotaxis protein